MRTEVGMRDRNSRNKGRARERFCEREKQTGKERVQEDKRAREADRERGTQGSFHGLPWRAGRAPVAAVPLGQKLAWDKERERGEIHACTCVLMRRLALCLEPC